MLGIDFGSIAAFAAFRHYSLQRMPAGHEGWGAYAPFYDWENARTMGRRDSTARLFRSQRRNRAEHSTIGGIGHRQCLR